MTNTTHHAPAYQDRAIIRPREAAEYLGIGRTTLYRYVNAGLLPRPIKIGPQVTGWRLSVLDDFLHQRERAAEVPA